VSALVSSLAAALPGASALPGAAFALPGAPLLAAGQSTPTPPPAPASGQEFGSASTLGFVVLVLFFIAVAFLARSMAKHLKRIQKPFEEAAQAEQAAQDSSDSLADSDASADPAPEADSPPAAEPTGTKQHKADA
jgi:ABC-type sulfate transport system permease component